MDSDLVTFRIGNEYRFIADERDCSLSRSGQLKQHEFTLFARVVRGDASLVRSVVFHLHPSFEPQSYEKRVAPYQTKHTCYGFFTARVEICWYRRASNTVEHEISFHNGGASRDFVFAPGARGTLEDVDIPNLTFGVEIELILPSRIRSRDELANRLQSFGIDARHVGYSKEITDYWKICSDASICCSRNDPQCTTAEFVSPILSGKNGLHAIESLFGVLSELGAEVNRSAGFHVHVGSASLTLEELKKICANFVKYEAAFDSLVPDSRRGVNNTYLKSHVYQFGLSSDAEINRHILSRNRMNGLLKCFNNMSDRYFKLNLQRVQAQSPTIEFRQHSGTANFEKVRAWVLLLLHFVANSAKQPPPDNFASERQPNYQRERLFRWVIKEPLLEQFFEARAIELGSDRAEFWQCACGKRFPHVKRLIQHQKGTGHSNPLCCDSCGKH